MCMCVCVCVVVVIQTRNVLHFFRKEEIAFIFHAMSVRIMSKTANTLSYASWGMPTHLKKCTGICKCVCSNNSGS